MTDMAQPQCKTLARTLRALGRAVVGEHFTDTASGESRA